MAVVSLSQQGSPMRNGLWFRVKGCLFFPEEGKGWPICEGKGLISLGFSSTHLALYAQITLADREPVLGAEIDVDPLHVAPCGI